MMQGQLIPAFIAALLAEGVEPNKIQDAVARVRSVQIGKSITEDPLHRAFAFEQTDELQRAVR